MFQIEMLKQNKEFDAEKVTSFILELSNDHF